MPARETSLKAYFMRSFNSKIVYQKCVTKKFRQLYINCKSNKNILNTKIQLVAIKSLLYLTQSRAKVKFLYPSKH